MKVSTIVILAHFMVSMAFGQVSRYVDVNNSAPSAPYTSWTSAATNITDATSIAGTGDTIRVAAGTYYLTTQAKVTEFTLESKDGPATTIINNSLQKGLMVVGSNALVKGFSITGQKTNAMGTVIGLGAVLDSCWVYGNTAVGDGTAAVAGVAVEGATIKNSLIYSNRAVEGASTTTDALVGGVLLFSGVISNTQIYACEATGTMAANVDALAGGVYCAVDTAIIDSVIEKNTAYGRAKLSAGGIIFDSTFTLKNSTVRCNEVTSFYDAMKEAYLAGGVLGVSDSANPAVLFEDTSVSSNIAYCGADLDGVIAGGMALYNKPNSFTTVVTRTSFNYNQARTADGGTVAAIGGIMGPYCTLSQVDVIGNVASGSVGTSVGGIYIVESQADGLCVKENNANGLGLTVGGCGFGPGTYERVYVAKNAADGFGNAFSGVYMSSATLRSALIMDNRSTSVAQAGTVQSSDCTMDGCTIAGNRATVSDPNGMALAGVLVDGGSFINSISAHNVGGVVIPSSETTIIGDGTNVFEVSGGQTTFSYSCFKTKNPITNGGNNLSSDPAFINVTATNYRLQALSPCRQTGLLASWMTNATDIAGLDRSYRGKVDRGAYRFLATENDFDGDGKSDIGCYYAPSGRWDILRSTEGPWSTTFGYLDTDLITGDFDGDGICDYGVYYDVTGLWDIQRSSEGFWNTSFGYMGTVPITGDFDGDGISDYGCYFADNGQWYILKSKEGFWETNFGYGGTLPVTGDFDGDGRCDFGCYYPPTGSWYIQKSREGFWETNFGFGGTVPVTGDFDGDGCCDFGCYYAPGGNWYVQKSSDGFWETNFGFGGTIAITGDYDGDALADFGCYYPAGGNWYVYKSSEGNWSTTFGYAGTIPLGR